MPAEPVDLADLDAVEPWRADAACREAEDPTVFFPGRGGRAGEAAKAICERCPVRTPCLDFALRRGIRHGIFGGLFGAQRDEMIRSGVAASA